ncbi:VOC family protein [Aliiroseovarius crassostreae]|uniref:VOC family protein n=1 Tax=Aliiroseovarius crassostreae TaxID=154981 RepID=UPI00220C646E|nr:VOC family protein [Aliiroseovarius crassostreae]UWP92299.1 VOC family protein [Aliiroseovarius crassostreae]UWP98604.1 VOC family protein [Aliiroseovarius crassostreae]
MKQNRVTLITLGVESIERSCAYYQALGWEPSAVLPEVAFFDMNGMKFGFFTLEGLARETGRSKDALKTGAMTLAQNYPGEAEVDAAFAKAIAAGGTAVTQPTKTDWGGYSGYVADPDGHLWEFAFNPFWELDEDGHLL